MPHLTIDYSANMEEVCDIAGLCDHLRRTAAGLDVFPETGVRVRAHRADHVSIGDGDPVHGYVDISVRLREGRAQVDKENAVSVLFGAAREYLYDVINSRPVMLSMEMRDIDAQLSPKVNTVREWIERKK